MYTSTGSSPPARSICCGRTSVSRKRMVMAKSPGRCPRSAVRRPTRRSCSPGWVCARVSTGNWLGALDAERVKNTLAGYGIDVSRLTTTDDGGTHEFVVADGDSRTVFGNYVAFGTGSQQWNEPLEEDIAAASIVCLDPYLGESSLRAAEYCVAHSTPYVTLDVPFDGYIAQHAAAISVSHELRDQSYAGQDMRLIFQRFIDSCPGLIVFTFGGDELWYGRARRRHDDLAAISDRTRRFERRR